MARLVAQALQRRLAALDQLVVGRGGLIGVALGGLAQFVGGELVAQLVELDRQVFLQLGQPGAAFLDAGLGVGARILGTLTQAGDDLVDRGQGQIGSADGGQQRALRSSMVG